MINPCQQLALNPACSLSADSHTPQGPGRAESLHMLALAVFMFCALSCLSFGIG